MESLIRKFIIDNTFANRIIDFADLPVFDGALTYVSIFFLEKKQYEERVSIFIKFRNFLLLFPHLNNLLKFLMIHWKKKDGY